MWQEAAFTRQQRHRHGFFVLLTRLPIFTLTHQNAHFQLTLSALKVTGNNTATLCNDAYFMRKNYFSVPYNIGQCLTDLVIQMAQFLTFLNIQL